MPVTRYGVAILGYGQLGRALATAMAKREGGVCVWTRRDLGSLPVEAGIALRHAEELADAVRPAGLVWLAVTDGALGDLVDRLAKLDVGWKRKVVVHSSGASSTEALAPLARLGAATAVCHPLRAVPGEAVAKGSHGKVGGVFAGAPFTIEGSDTAVAAARALVEDLGGELLTSSVADRTAYHLAATVASNYGLLLRRWSASRFEAAGLGTAGAARAADALLRNALDNAAAAGEAFPLTGPIRRGDLATVEAHLTVLTGRELVAYAALGLLLLASASLGAEGKAIERALLRALDRGRGDLAREDER